MIEPRMRVVAENEAVTFAIYYDPHMGHEIMSACFVDLDTFIENYDGDARLEVQDLRGEAQHPYRQFVRLTSRLAIESQLTGEHRLYAIQKLHTTSGHG